MTRAACGLERGIRSRNALQERAGRTSERTRTRGKARPARELCILNAIQG
jgi:hypothetical protein